IPEYVLVDAGDAVDRDVGQGFVPADGLVDLGAQAEGAGHCVGGLGGAGGGVPGLEVGPDEHQLAGAEAVAVGDGSFLVGALPGTGVDEGAQLLGQRDQGGGNRLAVQPGHAEDARGDAQAGLGGEQGLHAGVLAVGGGADDVAGGLRVVYALFYAYNDGDGAGLVGDGLQAARQGALGTGGADGGGDVG